MSENGNKQKNNNSFLKELTQLYYQHQYERMAKHEEQSLTLSKIVVSLTIASFAVGFSDIEKINMVTGLILPVAIIASNIFAIIYIRRSHDTVTTHRNRAKKATELYAQELHCIDEKISWPNKKSWWGRSTIAWMIHALLIVLTVMIIFYFYFYIRPRKFNQFLHECIGHYYMQ